MRFEAGTQFAGYTVVSRLGRGGMATVYLAREPDIDRLVALKVLPEHLVDEADFAERFAHEARVIGALDHPNIVPLYRYGITEDIPWMALRYVGGGDLATRLTGATLTHAEGLAVLRSVAAALDYAHGKGIVHRDLKPQNILLSTDGAAYLADFGVAKILAVESSSKTVTGGILGTPAYMAPEQAQGQQLGPFTDVYALAVIAFQWLVGTLPFDADTPQAILMKHVLDPVPSESLHRLDPHVAAVIARGLAKRPQDRFASAGALISELAQALLAAPASARPTLPAQSAASAQLATTVKRAPTRPAFALIVGIVVAALCVALAAFWYLRNHGASRTTTAPNQIAQPTIDNAKATSPSSNNVAPPIVNKPHEATLVIDTDLACELSVNGGARGMLNPGKPLLVRVPPGEQLVECANSTHPDMRVRLKKTIVADEQAVAMIALRDKIASPPNAPNPSVTPAPAPDVAKNDGARFFKSSNNVIEDRHDGASWAQSDNGADIDADEARGYCTARGARWRVPTIAELETLYDPTLPGANVCAAHGSVSYTCKTSPLFHLTSFAFWSATRDGDGRVWQLNLFSGRREIVPVHSAGMARVLCVRER